MVSRKEQIAATYLRLCLVHVDFLVLRRVQVRSHVTMLWLHVLF